MFFDFLFKTPEQSSYPTVVLIDDDSDFLKLLEFHLTTRYHLNVLSFDNPVEALNELRRQKICPNLVLCDLHMPYIDGFHLRKKLRKSGVEIPFVFISADCKEDIYEDDYTIFQKPVGVKKLENVLEESINY